MKETLSDQEHQHIFMILGRFYCREIRGNNNEKPRNKLNSAFYTKFRLKKTEKTSGYYKMGHADAA